MIDQRNRQLPAVADVADSATNLDDLEWYGYDPNAPHPTDDGLAQVEVEDVQIELNDYVLSQLSRRVDPLVQSDSFGIDLYEETLSILLTIEIHQGIFQLRSFYHFYHSI